MFITISALTFLASFYLIVQAPHTLSLVSDAAPGDDPQASAERSAQQKVLNDYLSIRDECIWGERSFYEPCGMYVSTCIVNATLPEGTGYYHIARFGPITTHGGVEDIKCQYKSHIPKIGSWFTRAMTAPIDPFTGDVIGYPPMHIHHSVYQNLPHPPIPHDMLLHMPWLSSAEVITASLGIAGNAADSECDVIYGGTSCLAFVYPRGYGRKAYEEHDRNFFRWHLQDVRLPHSPPMTVFMESAQFYALSLNPSAAPLMTAFDLGMAVGGKDSPNTYDLDYDTAALQFVTYYFSMTVDIVGTYFHTHSVHGDEGWLVRGTQQDLGIPLAQQRAVMAYGGPRHRGSVHLGISLQQGKRIGALMDLMERNIDKAAAFYDQVSHERKTHSHHMNEHPGFEFIPFDEKRYNKLRNNASLAPAKPQILCKWRTANSEVTTESVQAARTKWYEKYNKLVEEKNTKRSIYAPGENKLEQVGVVVREDDPIFHPHPVDNSVFISKPHIAKTPNITTVSAAEQGLNRFNGIKPGQYYRRLRNTAVAGKFNDPKYPHCDRFVINAGEYITVVHFNQPRLAPSTSDQYDHTINTMHQHSLFVAQGHVRGYPYY